MTLSFYKYQGTGNDFIIIDDRQQKLPAQLTAQIPQLCHRRLGIGADGVILLRNRTGFDFEMVYYNANGSQSGCGNGGRCAVHLAQHLGIIRQEAHFWAIDGAHQAYLQADGLIRLKMHVTTSPQRIQDAYFLHTGAPHYVTFVTHVATHDVAQAGRAIRQRPPFQKAGTNVNFVELVADNTLTVRTYERGVEDETLSCGTGVTAAALVAAAAHDYTSPVRVNTSGGPLQVTFVQQPDDFFLDVHLIGPAEMVFQGTLAH